jgi:2-polyprenyl-6-methoxyphenol hydroxylase-like FAD-dependent oxidoreductase
VSRVDTASRYVIRHAIADRFFLPIGEKGKLLLIGDAAHVNSPAGTQGMNLGIRDAVAMGRAIALHIRSDGNDRDEILATVAARRRHWAMEVDDISTELTDLSSMYHGYKRFFRNKGLQVMSSIPPLLRRHALQLAGLQDKERHVAILS